MMPSVISRHEHEIARKMHETGHRWVVQIVTKRGAHGGPLYFKSVMQIGPVLRSFDDQDHAVMSWCGRVVDLLAVPVTENE